MTRDEFLSRLGELRIWRRRGERAPHKPLLLLLALGRLLNEEPRLGSYTGEIETPLRDLLERFGPPRRSIHPEHPFGRLVTDGVWETPGTEGPPPTAKYLREHRIAGGFPEPVQQLLLGDRELVEEAAARLLAALRRWGLPVPAPLHARRRGAGGPFVAMALLAGQSDYDPQDRAAAALQMAAFLARLHVRAPAHRFSFLPRLASPLQLAGPERAMAQPLLAARALLETAPVPAAAHGRCLLHGDFWPGNLLWWEGKLAAAVDWEDAAIGDPLADVAIARCDLGWGFGLCAMELFTRRYDALTGFDLAGLPLWDIAAVLRQAPHAADYAEGWQELGRADVTRAAIAAVHRHLAREAVAALTA